MLSTAQENFRFLISWLRSPRTVASAIPSSRALARLMAAEVPGDAEVVVELGGGTGAITRALLDRGIAPGRLLVLEQHADLAELLRRKFGGLRVMQEDAQNLCHALRLTHGRARACAIVSGLPLLTLPMQVRDRILEQAAAALAPGGAFLQFTYGPRSPVPPALLERLNWQAECIGRIWNNIPPARVWRYTSATDIAHLN